LTNARRDVELSLVQLKMVMGISPASRIEIAPAPEYRPGAGLIASLAALAPASTGAAGAALPADLAALLRLAERQRPELRAAEERVRGAQADTGAARSAQLPQVSLFGMADAMKMRRADA